MTPGEFVEECLEAVDVTDFAQTDLIRLLVGVPLKGKMPCTPASTGIRVMGGGGMQGSQRSE
jgi:hypothetical protein